MKKLFTERAGLTRPRVNEQLDEDAAEGLLGLIKSRVSEHWFGEAFPAECEDGGLNSGCDPAKLKVGLKAFDVIWPADWPDKNGDRPKDPYIFDLAEFCYEHVVLPEISGYHSFWKHNHYEYNQELGRVRFTDDINRVFERHGLAFELVDGEVIRQAPTGLQEALAEAVFRTGDDDLDRLLGTAREKFLNKSLDVRKEALEKIWDAWERLKTVEPGKDKKASVVALLDRAATEPNLRARLETEALELTEIGNAFMITHTETSKPPITDSAHVDYLFHRVFAFIRLLLKKTGRGN